MSNTTKTEAMSKMTQSERFAMWRTGEATFAEVCEAIGIAMRRGDYELAKAIDYRNEVA